MDVHQKCLALCSCCAARRSHSMFCGCHADHNCHNEHACSVAGVAHVEQGLAADWCDLQAGIDEDDDVVPSM